MSIASTFLKPAPSDSTWNPPLSVNVGPVPVHERPEPACLLDDVGPGLQVQVIGVGQNSLCAKLFHGFRQHRLDGGLGADGDERRRVDVAVRGADHAGATEPSGQFGVNAEERLAHAVDSAL